MAIRPKPLSSGELSDFCVQMAMLLKAGVPSVREALCVLRDDLPQGAFRALVRHGPQRRAGEPFSAALASAGVFPRTLSTWRNRRGVGPARRGARRADRLLRAHAEHRLVGAKRRHLTRRSCWA